tara:strand:- start:550 stop:1242 length:693 start_codon:yes stop_codon:yes gene_type:complete
MRKNQLKGRDLVELAVAEYGNKLVLMSAFNPEDVIISYWLSEIAPNTPILFIDTKKHFPETLAYVDRITKQLKLTNVKILEPDPQLLINSDPDGHLWEVQVNRCCWLRKVEPLERAIKAGDYKALITGRRRGQNTDRIDVEFIEKDPHDRTKYNPLLDWTRLDRDQYMIDHDLPHHPLYHLGYLSIGCAPCTTPVYRGEDARAGRWRHTRLTNASDGKTECGLHVAQHQG